MRETLLRGAVLVYLLLIWLAVWPFPAVPVLGSGQRAAQDLLMAASLRPGMRVFSGDGVEDVTPYIACVRVLGLSDGLWQTLYQPECPRVGAIFYDDPLDRAISQMLQARLIPLFRAPLKVSKDAPDAVRHVIELADFFCHSREGLERILIRRRQHKRVISDGTRLPPENQLVCVQQCDSQDFSPPECSLRAVSNESRGSG